MRQGSAAIVAAALGLLCPPSAPARAQDAASTEDMVDALNGVFGNHKGYRAVHAKGFCAAGSF